MVSTGHPNVRMRINLISNPLAFIDPKVRWWWQSNPYVTLRILTNGLFEKDAASTELKISQCIAHTDHKSRGARFLRTALNSFEVTGPGSTHVGLVYTPMRESVSTFQRRLSNGRIPGYFLKPLLEMLLAGLDHLHTRCHIIHTGTPLVYTKFKFAKLTRLDRCRSEAREHSAWY